MTADQALDGAQAQPHAGTHVLAESPYGGKVAPGPPAWLIDGTKPSRLAWYMKKRILPPPYWDLMLKGREWMAQPEMTG